jgi:exodeoxyribonuclease VII small subunit
VSNNGEDLDFEQAFKELEELVERLEHGDMTLEDSLRAFERGLALHQACQRALDDATRKVEILTRKDGGAAVQPFEPDDR